MQDIRGKAHGRLGQRYRRLVAKGTHAHVVTVAIARELVGFVWAIAKEVPLTLERPKDRFEDPILVRNPWRRCTNVHEKTQPRFGVTLGGVKRPYGDTRPSIEAGTRRRQVRWYPTHGEQQDQPSSLPGSASFHAQR